ncbi:hypothetical protein QBC46DRAFT_376724 [Diplogelasinospora grovesii]|uniref:Zn(2)-C6 fungal-type domain-containing protein n=1 Tax=Diplogelasinospora grovesii TaxID=303347 RepID=A0AAN6NDB6_9PEZI|nr:hypothetical protein QBC46DRAFT_376724 [Diplogelasinospora grovesii]
MPDIGTHESQDSNVWLKVSSAQLPRLPQYLPFSHPHAPPSPEGHTASSSSSPPLSPGPYNPHHARHAPKPPAPRRRASPPPGPRTRNLRKPEETNEVRKRHACYHCRIRRVKCDAEDICGKCQNECKKVGCHLPQKSCIRRTLSETLGPVVRRWSWKEFAMPIREQFRAERSSVWIDFSEDAYSSPLHLTVGAFTPQGWPAGDLLPLGIVPNEGPSDQSIYNWVSGQIATENLGTFESRTFESLIEGLLCDYVDNDCLQRAVNLERHGLDNKQRVFVQTQKVLMRNLRNMSCMWKLWSSDQLFHRLDDVDGAATRPFHEGLQSVHAWLRLSAEQAMSTLERDILRDMDSYLSPIEIRHQDKPILASSVHVAMWISMWQIILIYRQSLSHAYAGPLWMRDKQDKQDKFWETTEHLFNGVVVIYSALFRTRNVLENLRDASLEAFGNDKRLQLAFQQAWAAHSEFYLDVGDRYSSTDSLFKSHIIAKEESIFGRKRQVRKGL